MFLSKLIPVKYREKLGEFCKKYKWIILAVIILNEIRGIIFVGGFLLAAYESYNNQEHPTSGSIKICNMENKYDCKIN